mmetsp:Transcript_38782/g.128051  ORF Transcript_38782/g.128051 Transcript_38782/m.128051 type:complete len:477 (-) Transcript_38782:62-1492(-)
MAEEDFPAEECPICMGALVDPCRTRCGHIFCSECLKQSFPAETATSAGRCPLCRGAISLFSTVSIATESALRPPALSTIFGTTFLQGGRPGVASYHFEAPDDCFISYESAPAAWTLDDGSRPPPRKPFLGPSYDAASRTFTGSVDWSGGTINGGDARWEYRLVFSESMNVIEGGGSWCYGEDGGLRAHRTFPDNLVYWRALPAASSPRGLSFLQGSRVGLASYHFGPSGDGAEGSHISYAAADPSWRLDDGSAPPPRVPFLEPTYDAASRTFRGSVDWSPTSFHGDERWEYLMTFSESFDRIADGRVNAFRPGGEPGDTCRFSLPPRSLLSALGDRFSGMLFRGSLSSLLYERHDEARAEMEALLRARRAVRRSSEAAEQAARLFAGAAERRLSRRSELRLAAALTQLRVADGSAGGGAGFGGGSRGGVAGEAQAEGGGGEEQADQQHSHQLQEQAEGAVQEGADELGLGEATQSF